LLLLLLLGLSEASSRSRSRSRRQSALHRYHQQPARAEVERAVAQAVVRLGDLEARLLEQTAKLAVGIHADRALPHGQAAVLDPRPLDVDPAPLVIVGALFEHQDLADAAPTPPLKAREHRLNRM